MCGDGVVVVLKFVVMVFFISKVVEFGQGSLAGLGDNCCVG